MIQINPENLPAIQTQTICEDKLTNSNNSLLVQFESLQQELTEKQQAHKNKEKTKNAYNQSLKKNKILLEKLTQKKFNFQS